MVVVLLVAASREPVSESGQWHPQKMSGPAEILPDEEVLRIFILVTLSCLLTADVSS